MRKYILSLSLLEVSITSIVMLSKPFIYVFNNNGVCIFLMIAIALYSSIFSIKKFVINFVDTNKCNSLINIINKVVFWNSYRKYKTDFTYKEYKKIKAKYRNVRLDSDRAYLCNTKFGEKLLSKRTSENYTDYILFVDKEIIVISDSLNSILITADRAELYYTSELEIAKLLSGLPSGIVDFFNTFKGIVHHWGGDRWYLYYTPPNWHLNLSDDEFKELKSILINNGLMLVIGQVNSYIVNLGKYGIDPIVVENSYHQHVTEYKSYNI